KLPRRIRISCSPEYGPEYAGCFTMAASNLEARAMPDTPRPEPAPIRHLADLRDSMDRLLDCEKLLPADGQALLDMLRQAEERIAAGETGEAGGLLLGFEALLRALADSGVLESSASDHCVVKVREASHLLNT